jgi:hypothetical protein
MISGFFSFLFFSFLFFFKDKIKKKEKGKGKKEKRKKEKGKGKGTKKRKRKKEKGARAMSGHGDEILREFQTNKDAYTYVETYLTMNAHYHLEKHDVKGDGHCFFYAVIRCIAEALPLMSPACVDSAKVAIGAGVLLAFLDDPGYPGIPSDVTELRGAVSAYMHENGETEECQASSQDGHAASIGHQGVGSRGYADVDCHYAQAISNAIGIGIAIEAPVSADAPKKWIFSQPDDTSPLSLSQTLAIDRGDRYAYIRANGTQTESVHCTDVIYLSLDGVHFQSYVYKARLDHGARKSLARSLRNEIHAQREGEREREREREERERERREDEEQRVIDKDTRLARETHDGEVARVAQENADGKLARRLAEQERKRTLFGATRPQRNRAFVSHVLRAARSTRFRY